MLLNKFENPSFEYFFGALLERYPNFQELFESHLVIRYLPKNYALRAHSIYFFDDDLFSIKSLCDIPFFYAIRIFRKSFIYQKKLLGISPNLFVSTPYLAKKYAVWNPRILRPILSSPLLERSWIQLSTLFSEKCSNATHETSKPIRICYHGTWSHARDMKWLAPVIAQVQHHCHNTIFEVIGGDRVAKIFKNIPRVSILPAMAWSKYLKHTQSVRQDIGLAPLCDTLFNRGRCPIKFFDYARAGAVGIYSAGPAFSDFVSHGKDGFILENDQSIWIETIVKLVNSPNLRQSMADAAWQKALSHSLASSSVQEYLHGLNKALDKISP